MRYHRNKDEVIYIKKHLYKLIVLIIIVAFSLSCLMITGNSYIPDSSEDVVVPILMYHEVKTYKVGRDVITPNEFESDLKYLLENRYTTITMTDLIDHVYKNKELPENPIILSFDDGYLNNYVYAFPLLKKYNMKAVFSIIGKNADDFSRIPDDSLDYSHASWDQINEMLDSGCFEVQNHTYNLHSISQKRYACLKNSNETLEHYEKVLADDLEKLQLEVIANTGFIPNTFVYPYGKVSKESIPILKKLGFQATLTCDYGVNIIGSDPDTLYGLKRICRSHGKPVNNLITEAMATVRNKTEQAFEAYPFG